MGGLVSCEKYTPINPCDQISIDPMGCVSDYDELYCLVNDPAGPDEIQLCASEGRVLFDEPLFYQTLGLSRSVAISCEDEKNPKSCAPLVRSDETAVAAAGFAGNLAVCPFFSTTIGATVSFEGIRFAEGSFLDFVGVFYGVDSENGGWNHLTPAFNNIAAFDYTCNGSITGTFKSDFDDNGKGIGRKFLKAGDDNLCDDNGPGRRRLAPIPDSEEVNQIFDLCDLDKDDSITKDEAISCLEHMKEQEDTDTKSIEDISREAHAKITNVFDRCDTDTNDSVSKYEALVCVPRARSIENL